MDDFKIIARLLAAVKASQDEAYVNYALIDENALRCTAITRDRLALLLQDEGCIKGLKTFNDAHKNTIKIVNWDASNPQLTLKGVEYISTNEPLKRAIAEMKDIGIAVASQTLANTTNNML